MPLWLIVIAVVLLVAAYALTAMLNSSKKQQGQEPAKLKDFKFPIPEEGAPQIVTFGDMWTPNWQVLWVGNYQSEAIHAQGTGGKKG